jgi:hypothetical protein
VGKLDYYIWLNSHNREEMCYSLCKQLVKEFKGTKYKIVVWMDGCSYTHRVPGVSYIETKHHGREKYYILFKTNINVLPIAEHYIKLDDDLILVDGFRQKMEAAWNSITDKRKVSLNLLRDNRNGVMWGSRPRKSYNDIVDWSDWVDLIFLADGYKFLQYANRALFEPPVFGSSSGVARQFCRHLRGWGTLYQVKETLVLHGDHKSEMNPNRKRRLSNI